MQTISMNRISRSSVAVSSEPISLARQYDERAGAKSTRTVNFFSPAIAANPITSIRGQAASAAKLSPQNSGSELCVRICRHYRRSGALSLRETLAGQRFNRILEIGCGTGKNTAWLQGIGGEITAVDLSEGMLAEARRKVPQEHD